MRRLVVVNTFLKGKSSSNKIIGIYFSLIFLFLFTFSIQPSQSATLFSDDFSSGNYNNCTLPSGSGATFTVVNGELRQTNTSPDLNKPWILYPNGYGWNDYELNLKARHVSGYYSITDIRVHFRMQSDQTSGYILQLHGLNWVELYKMSGTTLASVQKSSLPFSTPNYTGYTIKIKVSGNSIKVWVDGTQYIDVTDNTYSSGTIGLGSTHVVAGFDDIVVTDSTSSSTPSFTKIGSLPITVDGLTSIFDPATKSLYLFPNWPNYYNQVYRTTHDASDSLSWTQITTGPTFWNYWGRPEVLPGVSIYFTGAFYQGSTIYKANINSNGTLGSWTTTTDMLNQYWARALHQSQIYNGKFYINGGWQSDYGPNYDDIIAATVNSDGTLGNFTRVGTLPYQVLGHSTYLANNKMYFVHGDKIQIANINADGSIGSFVPQTYPISHGNYGTRGIVVIDNYLVVNDIQKTHIFQLNSSGNVTGLLYTINNPVEFNQRYVYVNNNKVYILDGSGVYRLDGLGGSVSQYTLSVMKTGTGSGTVTSNPAGIDCGSTCSATFNQNTQVTLTATAASNSTFAGWSGDCSGSSTTCTVTMNSAKNVTAMFNVTQCSYSINPSNASFASNGGSGSVAVTVSPSGCSGTWTAVSNVSWITITSGSSGTGNGTVSYSVSQNTTTSSRTGTITIGGQTHTVTQSPPTVNNINVVLSQIDTTQCPIVKGYVTVRDSSGNPITGLNSSNFNVKEDGVVITPITVTPVGSGSVSIAVAMTLDYSGSMSNTDVSNMENAAETFINMMNSGDAMEVIKFSTTVAVLQGYTQDKVALTNAIRQSWSGRGGKTAFYDSVYKGLQDTIANQQYSRKAIIAMTDGQDNQSSKTITQVIDYAKANGIPIYTVGFGSVDRVKLEQMARETGGMYYYAPDSSGLQAIYNSIANTLNNQYIVSYRSSIQDGQQHDMRVEVSYQGQSGSDSRQFTACGSLTRYSLTITKGGTGSGTVTSNPSGISCGSSCISTYGSGISVLLTAAVSSSSMVVRWEGDCLSCGSGLTCQVLMDRDKSCNVKFMQVSADGCYSVDISPMRYGSSGGTGQIKVEKVTQSCPDYEWYVMPDVNFILFPTSCVSGVCDMTYGSGIGKVDNMPIKVLANSSQVERAGKLSFTMLGIPIEISQDAGSCTTCGISFNDVDVTHWAKNYIYSIGCAGITQGCGSNIYCPNYEVTRGQMAAFIVRAKEGNPPVNYCGGSSPFNDVGAGDTFCNYIKRLAELQITQGCGSGRYCPNEPVTRGQMAAFIIRAKYGESFNYTQTPYFSDVPTNHPFFKYVQKMKDEGITAVSGVYNVDSPVSRAEMAAFLYRAFLQQNCGVLNVVRSGAISYDELFKQEIGEGFNY